MTGLNADADDISFLVDAFDLPFDYVSEIYQNKHSSCTVTAVEILDQAALFGVAAQDEESIGYVRRLEQNYDNVPDIYMRTLVQLTGPNGQFSDQVASLLCKHFTKHPWTKKLDITYRLAPLPQEEMLGLEPDNPGGSASFSPKSRSLTGVKDHTQALSISSNQFQARRDAQASVFQLNRSSGAFKHLNRQAASVFAERARDYGRQGQQAAAVAADLLVDRTATSDQIDLHGLTVYEGVRIARQRVEGWWQGLGEFPSMEAKQRPFTVVTGLGKHSAGGVSPLRRAVAAALLQDGWKLEVETGRYIVSGRR